MYDHLNGEVEVVVEAEEGDVGVEDVEEEGEVDETSQSPTAEEEEAQWLYTILEEVPPLPLGEDVVTQGKRDSGFGRTGSAKLTKDTVEKMEKTRRGRSLFLMSAVESGLLSPKFIDMVVNAEKTWTVACEAEERRAVLWRE